MNAVQAAPQNANCCTPDQGQCGTPKQEQHGPQAARAAATYRPQADIRETPTGFEIVADVPGTTADRVSIEVKEGVLMLHAEVPARDAAGRRLAREYGVGNYRRNFNVGDGIDTENITAKLTDGVLTIVLPKAQNRLPRKVRVQA